MTRNLFFACALMAAAALATFRALDPGCEGSFCLGGSLETEADQDRAGASEVPNAGRELLGGDTRETALDDPDENIAAMAEQALADLQALEESREKAQQFN